MNKTKMPLTVLLGMLLIAACSTGAPPAPTQDPALIYTAAAETVFAQFTLTSAVWTVTPLPPPSETPAPLETATLGPTGLVPTLPGTTPAATTITLCDRYSWDPATVDVNTPDGTIMQPGQDFVKTWRIKNAGNCTWGEGYTIIYAGYADKMSGQAQPFTAVVGPGQEIEISVQFKAPSKLGEYVSAWTLANNKGVPFFGNDNKPVYVKIVVK
jgi:hypothetical protein